MRCRNMILCTLVLALICSWTIAQEVAPAAKKLKFKPLKYEESQRALLQINGFLATSDKEALIIGQDEPRFGLMFGVNRKAKATRLSSGSAFFNRSDTLWVEVDDGEGPNPSAALRGIVVSWNIRGLQPYTLEMYTSVLSGGGTPLDSLRVAHKLEDPLENRSRLTSVRAGLGEKSILVAAAIASRESANLDNVKTYFVLLEIDFNGRLLGKVMTVPLPSNGNGLEVVVQQPVWALGRWMVPCIYAKDLQTLSDNEGRGVMVVSVKRKASGGLNSGSFTTQMHSGFKLRGLGHNVLPWLQVIMAPVEQKNAPAQNTCVMIYETEVVNEGQEDPAYFVLERRYAIAVDATGKTVGESKLIPMDYFDPPDPAAVHGPEEIAGPLFNSNGDILIARSLYVQTGNDAGNKTFGTVEVYQIDPETFNSKLLAKTQSLLPIRFGNMRVSRSAKRVWIATEDSLGEVQIASFKSK